LAIGGQMMDEIHETTGAFFPGIEIDEPEERAVFDV
jgi:hypothetical protein